jgi:hypothetical protein
MANHTHQTPRRQHPALPSPSPSQRPPGAAGLVAGIGLLLITALAVFGIFIVLDGLVTPGDAARTTEAILNAEGMFRAGIGSLYVLAALEVVVTWALYWYFRPVSEGLSTLAAWFRLAHAGVFAVAISQLAGVLPLLHGKLAGTFTAAQQQAQALQGINAFYDTWNAALVLFGYHLLLVGWLAYRSGYVPKLLGILLAIAGLGYVIDSLATVLLQGPWVDISTFTGFGELLFALWLVIWGRRTTASELASDPSRTA